MLVAQNVRSLEERYPGRDFLQEWIDEAKGYKLERGDVKHTLTQIVKACDCYDYQACETEDYPSTAAAKYVAKVRSIAKYKGGKSKGKDYDAASWGID